MRHVLTRLSVALVLPVAIVVAPVVTLPHSGAKPVHTKVHTLKVRKDAAPASTDAFRMVSANWDPGTLDAGATVQVRTKMGDEWSDWTDLERTDVGPDPGSQDALSAQRVGAKDTSEPVWLDAPADAVQTRVVGGIQPSDLELTLIDPGTSKADANPGADSAPAASASAASQRPQILTRGDWGADESLRTKNCKTIDYTSTIRVGFVHHTAHGTNANDYTAAEVPALLRAIYSNDVNNRGWCDIAYNFLIDKFGRIWEGRAGGVDSAVLGAHTGGFNSNSFGAALIGNYETETSNGTTPPAGMLDSLERLFAWKLGIYGLDPLGTTTLTSGGYSGTNTTHPAGQAVPLNVVSGHRDTGATDCPGSEVYAQLPTIRTMVKKYMGAALLDPAVSGVPAAGASPVTVKAGMSWPGTWQLAVLNGSNATVRTLSGSGDDSVTASWDRTDASGRLVPNGPYRLVLTSKQNGQDADPWSVKIEIGKSFGGLERASASPGRINVTGWTLRDGGAEAGKVQVVLDDGSAYSFTANVQRGDVETLYPAWGNMHGYDVTVAASPGSHRVCVNGITAGASGTQLGCQTLDVPGPARSAADPASNPRGSIDQAVVTKPGELRLVGWALDPDTKGPIDVHVYIDGKMSTALTANGVRNDVASAFAGFGPLHGFDKSFNLAGGTHQVCVYGINVGPGNANPAIGGCRSVTLPTGPPYGSLDSVAVAPGTVQLSGWVIDPGTVDAVGVHVYVDGKFTTSLKADAERKDVGGAYPMYGNNHGYTVKLTGLPGGAHQVCVYGISAGGRYPNPVIGGCRTVTMPTGDPHGSLDSAQPVADQKGGLRLTGWAIDPKTVEPIRVHVYIDSKIAGVFTANSERKDVGAVYPVYGPSHGYDVTVSGVATGKHQVCVYGINAGAGTNPVIGACRSVTMP